MQEEEIQQGRWRRSPRAPDLPRISRRNRKKTKSSRDCHLEKKEMRVRDLGLGYDSDEIVLFKYCVGTCHSFRKNYDLALKALMDNGSISGKNVSSHPCCRPTRYETVSFMDTQTTWQTIKWLSAANCSCVSWFQCGLFICNTHTQKSSCVTEQTAIRPGVYSGWLYPGSRCWGRVWNGTSAVTRTFHPLIAWLLIWWHQNTISMPASSLGQWKFV